jgi:hypothetical protein
VERHQARQLGLIEDASNSHRDLVQSTERACLYQRAVRQFEGVHQRNQIEYRHAAQF